MTDRIKFMDDRGDLHSHITIVDRWDLANKLLCLLQNPKFQFDPYDLNVYDSLINKLHDRANKFGYKETRLSDDRRTRHAIFEHDLHSIGLAVVLGALDYVLAGGDIRLLAQDESDE